MRLKAFSLLLLPGLSLAWGPEGHRVIGVNARNLLDDTAREVTADILGGDSDRLWDEACSWPDEVRDTPEWEWSSPQHYVNIPRSITHYERQRDCTDGLCVTEAIAKYANELSRTDLGAERRWQALAWLCHLVGDLHQPLHAGYADDRGANLVDIEYRDRPYDLHEFWDGVVIRERLGAGDAWERPYPAPEWTVAPDNWSPAEIACWTDESHALAGASAYPPGPVIDEPFADQSWLIVRQQWQKAAVRLAQILNAVAGEGRVDLGE